jgi:hypothetical protein
MAIKLTPNRRSQLLEQLLKQNAEQFAQNPQSLGETIAKMLAMGIRQGQANKMQEQEAQTTKVRGANEAAALAEALGEQPKSVFGTPLPGQQAPGSMRQHLMTQNPDSAYGPALTQLAMQQKIAAQKPKPDSRSTNQKDYEYAVSDGYEGSFSDFLKMKKSSQTINVGGESLFKVPTGFMLKNPNDPTEGVVPIPGGPKDTLSPEQAAKVQLIETALESSENFQKYIVNPDGSVNRKNVYNMFTNTPFTEGREAKVYLLDAIEAKLRAESGAAVPETEVTRAGKRFKPHPFDSDSTIKIKTELLSAFLEGAFNKSQRDGRFDVEGTLSAVEKAAAEKFDQIGSAMIDTAKIPGFNDLSPEDQKIVVDQLILESRGVK